MAGKGLTVSYLKRLCRFRQVILRGGLAALTFYCSLAYSQSKGFNLEDPLARYKQQPTHPKAEAKALEGIIDPAEYILGPGDRLEVAVWGNIELTFDLFVSPDGSISIPGVGPVQVAGISVEDAEKTVIEKSRRIYTGAQVTIKLIEIRSMKVSISGAVEEPGVYELTSIDRLSTLIFFADGFLESEEKKVVKQENQAKTDFGEKDEPEREGELATLDEERRGPSKRKVSIVDRTGKSTVIDYLRYERGGDLRFNPVLKDGSQVHVPLVDSNVGVVHIFGAIKSPGEYEYIDGDRLLDIVDIAGGFRADASLTDIVVQSFLDDRYQNRNYTADLTDAKTHPRGSLLKMDDRIFVRAKPDYHPRFNIEVKGEVKYPGVYPIEDNATKLTEIIQTCGGFTDIADIRGGRVERTAMGKIDDPEYERLLKIPVGEMTDMEYEYFKLRSREVLPDVIVDFGCLFLENDLSNDILLRDRDVIEIPHLSPTVNVMGKVHNPGLVKYSHGENYAYYIKKTGGFSWNARKSRIRLIRAHSGVWEKPDRNTRIEIGDTIFIPEKKETNWWEYTKDILLVLSQLATIVVVVRTL